MRKKYLVYIFELSQKFDFQPSSTKLDNGDNNQLLKHDIFDPFGGFLFLNKKSDYIYTSKLIHFQ